MLIGIWRELLIVVIIFVLCWAGFSYLSPEIKKDKFTISTDKEEELAEALVENLLKQLDELESKTVDSAINRISGRLLDNIDSPQYTYKFYVVRSEQVNAFATLGGNVIIFSGLIEKAKSAEEVAAILAHEIGHVENRDVIKKIAKDLGLQVLTSILTGGDPSVIAEINKHILSSSYDRAQERKADEFAFQLLVDSGLKPSHFASFMLRMKLDENATKEEELEIISTHPASKSRIESAMEYGLPEGFEEQSYQLDWEKVKNALH